MKYSKLFGFLFAAAVPVCMADDSPASAAPEAGTTDAGETGAQPIPSGSGGAAPDVGASTTSTTADTISAAAAATTSSTGDVGNGSAAPDSQSGSLTENPSGSEQPADAGAPEAAAAGTADASGEGVASLVGAPSASDTSSSASSASTVDDSPAGTDADVSDAHPHGKALSSLGRLRNVIEEVEAEVKQKLEAELAHLESILDFFKPTE